MIDTIIWAIYFFSLYVAVFWILVLVERMVNVSEEKNVGYSPYVSVIVPAYNEEKGIAKCIDSLLKLDYPNEKLEIIVVNDGSKDDTKSICESYGDKIRFIHLEKNSGNKAVPLNIGLKKARGGIVACLDADSIVESDTLKKMLPYFNEDRVAAVTPALKVYRPKTLIQKMQWFEYLFAIFLRKAMSLIDCIYVTPGPFSLFKKDIVIKLGGFDEKNITEDMEIALRLQANGYIIRNAIDAYVHTITPVNLKELTTQRRRWYQGLIYNSMLYRKLIFNRDYGDFGIFMGLNVIGVLVLVASASLLMYHLVKPMLNDIYNLFLVDFDIMTYAKDFSINVNLLDIDYTMLYILVVVVMFGLFGLLISHRFSHERIRKYGLGNVIAFTMFYFILLGVLWIEALANYVSNGSRRTW
ncbi:MAG: glycosyltransferase [Candidatus Altiarchaeota archaeon]